MPEQWPPVPKGFQIALDDTFQQGFAQGFAEALAEEHAQGRAEERVRTLMHLAEVYGGITDAENDQYRARLEALVLDDIPDVSVFLEGLQAVEPTARPQAARRLLDQALARAPGDPESDDTDRKR